MRYSTKTQLLTGSAIVAAGFLSTTATAQDVSVAFSASELGATAYNPVAASTLNTATSLIFDRLVEQDADQSYHPHLATSWEETPDGMAWTFRLLEGVTFHDDTPFNAEAVQTWIASYEGTENEYLVEAIGSVDVIDDLTVRFNMDRPEPNLLYNLASAFMGIPSPTAYAALGDEFGVTSAIGTGPYELQSFEIGLETVLVRNEDYTWGSDLSKNTGAGHVQTFTFREIPDQSTAFLELRTGGIDLLLGVPTDFLQILEAEANIQIIQMPGTGISYMPINTTAPPFDDILVRQATTMAVDQDSIVAAIYNGVGAPARNFLISSLPEADVSPELNVTVQSRACRRIAGRGRLGLGDDGVRVKGDERLSVEPFHRQQTELTRLTQVIQAQLGEIGMEAVITVFDPSTIRDEYRRKPHQLAVRSYDWNNSDILDWFFSGNRLGYPNVSMWTDEEGQRLNDVAMSESATSAERIANFTAYHEYVLSQHLFVPIYQPTQNIAFNATAISVPDPVRGRGSGAKVSSTFKSSNRR
jgi:peptide/nickel transport system substrate-binding protein